MNKKTITCITYSPVRVYRDYQTPWDDVWIRYWNHRKRVHLGPTLCGLDNLRHEIEMEQQFPDTPERLGRLHGCLSALEGGALIAVEPDEDGVGVDTIYVNKELLTRADIEQALMEYLRQRGVLKGPARFRWKRPEVAVFMHSM